LLVGHRHNNRDRGFAYLQKILQNDDLFKAAMRTGKSTLYHFTEFYDYKMLIENNFKALKDISKAAEIMVNEKNPTMVYSTTKTLSCCIHPDYEHYENKRNILKDTSIVAIMREMDNIEKVSKNSLTPNKVKNLKEYYSKGLIRKDLWEYYEESLINKGIAQQIVFRNTITSQRYTFISKCL
jgi:hypothetical protein